MMGLPTTVTGKQKNRLGAAIIIALVVIVGWACINDDPVYIYGQPAWITSVDVDSIYANRIIFQCTINVPTYCYSHEKFAVEDVDSLIRVRAVSKCVQNRDCIYSDLDYQELCSVFIAAPGLVRFTFQGFDSQIDTTIKIVW